MVRATSWIVLVTALAIGSLSRPIVAQTTSHSTLDWQPTIEEAQKAASQSNRLILIHFWSPSCEACKTLEQNVYSQPQVQQQIHAKFVPFKINVDERPTTAKRYGIDRIPMDLIIDSKSMIVGRMNCPVTRDEYLQKLAATSSGPNSMAPATQTAVAATEAPTVSQPTVSQPAVSQPATSSNQAIGQTSPVISPATTIATPAVAAQPPVAAQQPVATQRYATQPPVATQPAVTPPSSPPTQPAVAAQPAAGSAPWASTAPARQAQPQQSAISAYSDDRYADFRKRWSESQSTPPTANAPIVQAPPAATASSVAAVAPAAAGQSNVTGPSWGTAGYSNSQYATAQQNAPTAGAAPSTATASVNSTAATPPPGAPPLGLEGYCPVTLVEHRRWQVGDKRWGVIHRGRTYVFAGPLEQKKFLDSPDRYSPAVSGEDVVATLDQGPPVKGQRQYGILYQNRPYLFSSAATRDAFRKDPSRYAAEVLQAESPNRGTTLR